jgi:hypothetical protein
MLLVPGNKLLNKLIIESQLNCSGGSAWISGGTVAARASVVAAGPGLPGSILESDSITTNRPGDSAVCTPPGGVPRTSLIANTRERKLVTA